MMSKATGIVRRIDDLGRIVIPKEIRRTLRIREGDPLEIFTDVSGEIVLKKYSHIGEIETFAKQYAETLARVSGYSVYITDREEIIAAAGGAKRELIGAKISKKLEDAIEERESYVAKGNDKKVINVCEDAVNEYTSLAVCTIICQGDAIGAVLIVSADDKIGEVEYKLANSAAIFMGKHLES
ncbi:MAG: AbrB/MazE/SpoVT family DNA-binding domain-containing protein [Lachnospiraceae bacterium]|nr:AbrB/MazE/SpoVT family DNA-binding domain-containing protein [Lachnospiraceae bacterium]